MVVLCHVWIGKMMTTKEQLDRAKTNLALAKMMRSRHDINRWRHRVKVLSDQLRKQRHPALFPKEGH